MKKALLIISTLFVVSFAAIFVVACSCDSKQEESTAESSGIDLPEDNFDDLPTAKTTVVDETTVVNVTDANGKVVETKVEQVKKTYIVKEDGSTVPYEPAASSAASTTASGETKTSSGNGEIELPPVTFKANN